MSELTLLLLRIGFLILMWAFVFAIVYALRSDLFGTRVRRMPATGVSAAGAASGPAPVAAPRPCCKRMKVISESAIITCRTSNIV